MRRRQALRRLEQLTELSERSRGRSFFNFKDTSLSNVVDYCSEHLDINIRLDPKGLTDAAVDPSAPVTFSTHKPVTFESALRLILEEFDLTFVIQNETLMITSKEKADEI